MLLTFSSAPEKARAAKKTLRSPLQKDRGHVHAEDEDKSGVFQQGFKTVWHHAVQLEVDGRREEGQDGSTRVRLPQADRPLPSALRQGRSIRCSVQVHSIADAQWTSQNHRPTLR